MRRIKEKKEQKIMETPKNKDDGQITVMKRNPVVRLSWAESEPVITSGILGNVTMSSL